MLQITYDFKTRPRILDKKQAPESVHSGSVRVTTDGTELTCRLLRKTEIVFEETKGEGAANQVLCLFLQANAAELALDKTLPLHKVLEDCPVPTLKPKDSDNRGGDYGLTVEFTLALVEVREVANG